MDEEFRGKRVLIRNEEGKYLGRKTPCGPVEFFEARTHACVYDYDKDRAREQLEQVEEMYGAIWTPEEYAPADGRRKA